MGSWNISSSSEPFSIIHISERVHGAFLRMRRISSVLINCCRIVLEKERDGQQVDSCQKLFWKAVSNCVQRHIQQAHTENETKQ